MLDEILILEIRKNYEELTIIEANCSEEERFNKHQAFKETLLQLLQLSAVARKEGLLELEEEAAKNYELSDMTRELVMLIVDGTEPQLVERFALMQYFSKKKDVYQSIKDIMSIYGILSIQAGEHPMFLWKMLNSMIPQDVTTTEYYYETCYADDVEKYKKFDWETFYQGDVKLNPENDGYSEIQLLDKLLKVLDNMAIQRVLRDVRKIDVKDVMGAISGEARRQLITNMSKNNAFELVIRLNMYSDEQLKNPHILDWLKDSADKILKVISKLEKKAEIIVDVSPDGWEEYKNSI